MRSKVIQLGHFFFCAALHYLEVFVKMRLMGLSGPAEYQPLREERAVQLGSEIIGEVFLYSVAASFLLYEYYRSVRKDQERDDSQDLKLVKIQERLKALDKEMNDMKAKVQVLEQNMTDSKSSQNKRS